MLDIKLEYQPLKDMLRSISYVRNKRDIFKIDKIIGLGFSAGGHVTGSAAVHYHNEMFKETILNSSKTNLDAAILCYPVITADKYSHKDSVKRLFGDKPTSLEKKFFSIDKNVTKKCPPIFIWHTITDDIVPYINSLKLAKALFDKGIKHELVLYNHGGHGLSLANKEWATGIHKSFYTHEQLANFLKYHFENDFKLPENLSNFYAAKDYDNVFDYFKQINEMYPQINNEYEEISNWTNLVDIWIKKTL